MYEIIITGSYRKKSLKFIKKHPDLKDRYKKTFFLLKADPFHELLDCKKMQGHEALYRIRLTIHVRIVLHIIVERKQIIPIDIDSRENIY